MSDILKKLTKEMQKVQDPKRFTHTLGVEYTAAALAMRYGEDVERAQIAGLLHDCAKCMEMINFCLPAKSIIFPRRMWKSAIPIFYMQEWEAIWRKRNIKSKILRS